MSLSLTKGTVFAVIGFGLLYFRPLLADETQFPPVKLRGLGTLSGSLDLTAASDQPASLLTINCEDEDKAKLVLAKFISNQQTLPGVEKTEVTAQQWGYGTFQFGGSEIPAYKVKSQGFFSAVRVGTTVLIMASPAREGLVGIMNKNLASAKPPFAVEPEIKVPMWLDRWDQHGFRFYYWPGSHP